MVVLVGVGVALVVVAMHRRRDHALRDRFAEEYDRVLHEHAKETARQSTRER